MLTTTPCLASDEFHSAASVLMTYSGAQIGHPYLMCDVKQDTAMIGVECRCSRPC